MDDYVVQEDGSDYEDKRTSSNKRQPRKLKEKTADSQLYNFDDAEEGEAEPSADLKKSAKAKKEPRKPRTQNPKKAAEPLNPGMIKTNNKLIGEIQNNDIYDSDENLPQQTFEQAFNTDSILGELDLGTAQPKGQKREMSSLLEKIRGKNTAIEHKVVTQLGLIDALGRKVNTNQLAAKGVLTLRDHFQLKQQSSTVSEKVEGQQPPKQKYEDDDSEEESGIVLVDPLEEQRRKLEQAKLEKKKDVPMIRLQDGTMVPSTAVGHALPGASSAG